jgi:type II secretory pathway component GspD/PulD (secretin)
MLTGCITTTKNQPANARYETTTEVTGAVPALVPVEASAEQRLAIQQLADRVWGMGPALGGGAYDPERGRDPEPSGQDPKPSTPPTATDRPAPTGQTTGPGQTAGQDPAPQVPLDAQRAAAIRSRFGPNVIVRPDGRVTKQYVLGGDTGNLFLQLLAEPGKPPAPPTTVTEVGSVESRCVLAQMLAGKSVELVYFDKFETVAGTNIAAPVTSTAPSAAGNFTNSMVLVTADVEALSAFEDALNLFFAYTPQVEIEVQIVEYSTTEATSFGVRPIAPGTPLLSNQSSKALIKSITGVFPLTPILGAGATGDVASRDTLVLGGIHDSWELNAIVQALETASIADIISTPRMVVRNGGIASVITTTKFPYPEARISSSGQNVTANIKFESVGVRMNIRPVIAGTDTVILEIFADVSTVTGFADTEPVDTPIISNRSATTSVLVPNRMTTVIGGLKTVSTLESESKIPLLGDIPILGYLFRATSTGKQTTTLAFHITPRIVEGPRGFRAN